MIEEAMKLIRLGMECDLSDMTEDMEAAFSAVFVAACGFIKDEFGAWKGESPSDEDSADLDIAAMLAEVERPGGDVTGAPV